MKRWISLIVLALLVGGCASGADVVDGIDDDTADKLDRFESEQHEIAFEAAGVQVHATLTTPAGKSDAPAVVLVAGSGPTDRDWNNPLLPGDNGTAIELSDRLAEAGIATMRYDKRGTGMTELPGVITWDDYLTELEEAVKRVEQVEGIDEERIFVAGHSEGGLHALRAKTEGRIDVAGLVLLATPGRTTEELVLSQVDEQLEDAGMPRESIDQELASLKTAMDAVSRGETVDAHRVSDIPGLIALVETLQTEDAEQFAAELLGWDPARAIGDIERSILIVNGLKDTQVDAEDDGQRLFEAADDEADVTLALIEDADHVFKFQPVPVEELGTQFSLTYNDPTRHLEEALLEALASWIYARQ